MITKIDFKNSKLCDCCHTKIATKLCDYIVGYWNVAFICGRYSYNEFANQNRYETCDLNLCDDCAHRHNGFDFCPNHWRLLQLAKKRGSFKLKGE